MQSYVRCSKQIVFFFLIRGEGEVGFFSSGYIYICIYFCITLCILKGEESIILGVHVYKNVFFQFVFAFDGYGTQICQSLPSVRHASG